MAGSGIGAAAKMVSGMKPPPQHHSPHTGVAGQRLGVVGVEELSCFSLRSQQQLHRRGLLELSAFAAAALGQPQPQGKPSAERVPGVKDKQADSSKGKRKRTDTSPRNSIL
jgi:hypothetical protein